MKYRFLKFFCGIALLLISSMSRAEDIMAGDVIAFNDGYTTLIKLTDGIKILKNLGDEYIEFDLKSPDTNFEDDTHFWLSKDIGVHFSSAKNEDFASYDKDLLSAHMKWELEYWKKGCKKLESKTRNDLIGSKKDIRVTEVIMTTDNPNDQKEHKLFSITILAKHTVQAISISGPGVDSNSINIDKAIRDIVHSLHIVPTALDGKEIARINEGLFSKSRAK